MSLISLFSAESLFKKIKRRAGNPEASIKNIIKKNPQTFEEIGEKLALAQFKRAHNFVPAYKEFINKSNIGEIKSFKDFMEKVPEIDKKNYIQKYSFKDLMYNGLFNNSALIYRSSGFSGKPAYWCKSKNELDLNKKQVTSVLRLTFQTNKYKTLIINCFDLSSWISGINIAKIADEEANIINVGSELEETIEIIQDIGRQYDQIILFGYPPFMKWLFESNNKINWKDYKISLLLGGEGFTSSFRNYMYEKYISQGIIISAYGTSDLGIPCASETSASLNILKIAEKNEELKKELFLKPQDLYLRNPPTLVRGQANQILTVLKNPNTPRTLVRGFLTEGQSPMLFQYNPTSYHIYSNKDNELIFTMLNLDAIQPLVKYNIHDVGGVISYNKMKEILQKNNANISMPLKFPFLCVYGRSTGEVKVCGMLIYPENIKDAIYKNKEIADKVTGVFKIYTIEKIKSQFCIDMELRKGLKNTNLLQKRLENLLEESLSKVNIGYKEKRKISFNETKIHLKLFNYGSFPHKSGIKIKYS